MPDREKTGRAYYTALTSLPMWMKYANGVSAKKISFERLMIKMKNPGDKKESDAFLRDLR
jgi:hypothetical protein